MPPLLRKHYSYYKQTTELLSKDFGNKELEKIQLKQLNKALEVAWKIQGYKKFWFSSGFNHSQLSDLGDYKEIPVIDKEYIRNNREDFKPLHSNYRTIKTGGSTGDPFQSYEPIYQQRIEQAFILHIWRRYYAEVNIKTKSTIIRGSKLDQTWKYDPMRGLFLTSYQVTKKTVLDFIELIDRYKTPILHAYPSSLFQFSKYITQLNKYPKHQFKLIALGSEPLAVYQYELFKSVFNAPIVNWYGHGEKVILAGTKPNHNSHFVEKIYGITELLNDRNEAVGVGEVGELVGTSLWNNVMPLIRYKTGDKAVSSKDWGKELKQPEILSKIIGRKHEFLVTKNKTLVPVTALTLSYGKFDEIKRVQFYQDEIGIATLHIELMDPNNYFNSDTLSSLFKELLGDQIDIKLNFISKIEPTISGKHIYLVQKLNMSDFDNDTES